jgi:hypothetical protein
MIIIEQQMQVAVNFKNLSQEKIEEEIITHLKKQIADAMRSVQVLSDMRDETLLDNLVEFCHTGR